MGKPSGRVDDGAPAGVVGGLLAFIVVLAAIAAVVWFMWPSGNVYRP